MAQPFDPGRAVTSGEPMALNDRIQMYAGRGIFSASDDGILAYQTSSGTTVQRLIWRDREGKQLEVLGEPARYLGLELSRDGIWAAVEVGDSKVPVGVDIWLFEIARGLGTHFTSDPAFERSPVWSPDGSQIVFSSNRKGKFDIYRKASSGAGGEELVFMSDTHKYPTSWSRDGRLLFYDEKGDIWALPMSGDSKPFSVVHTEFVEPDGQFYPDGHWVAYDSKESGDFEVYVTPFPGLGRGRRISKSGGRLPRWRRDGKELYYVARDGKLTVTEIRNAGPSIEAGASRPLFDLTPRYRDAVPAYDVSPDGRRFLVLSMDQPRPSPITLVTNWTAELKR